MLSIVSINKRQLLTVLFVLLFVGAYIDVPLAIGQTSIPSITNVILAIIITPFLLKRFSQADIAFLLSAIAIVGITVIGAGNLSTLPSITIKILQFAFSIYIFIITLFIIRSIPIENLRTIFFAIIIVLVVGIILEYLNIIRGLSDKFRATIYTGNGYALYDAEERDISMTGFVRPSFFTSEPSLVSATFFIVSMCYLLVSNRVINFLFVLGASFVFLVFSGSPIPVINIIGCVILLLHFLKLKWYKLLMLLTVFIFFFVAIIQSGVTDKIIDRLEARLIDDVMSAGNSSYGRIYVPYVEALPIAFAYNPIFGVGYGGKQKIATLTGNEGADITDGALMETIDGSNAFARYFMYLGLLGGLALLYVIARYFKSQSIKYFGLFVVIWIFYSQTLGTFETPRYWIYLALVASCLAAKTKNEKLIEKVEKNKSEKV